MARSPRPAAEHAEPEPELAAEPELAEQCEYVADEQCEVPDLEPASASDPGDDDDAASDSEYSEYNDDDPLQQISQLLITEDGEAVSDVLQGIRDALDKQNKILFKLCTVLAAGGAAQ